MSSSKDNRYLSNMTDHLGRGLSAHSISSTMSSNSNLSDSSVELQESTDSEGSKNDPPRARSRSQERGRSRRDSKGSNKAPVRKSRSRPRTHTSGPLHHIFSNFKSFGISSKEYKKDMDYMWNNSPKEQKPISQNTSPLSGLPTLGSGSKHHAFPSLSTFVPGSIQSQSHANSDTNSTISFADQRTGSGASTATSTGTGTSVGTSVGTGRSRANSMNTDFDKSKRSLRHADLPVSMNRKERVCFMRVYRSDGSFGTIGCAKDITAHNLLQLAARKFFITLPEKCHLLAVYPMRIEILSQDSHPIEIVHNLLIQAGYSSSLQILNLVCREDTGFLCRILLVETDFSLRPPERLQSENCLDVSNTDLSDAPSVVCTAPKTVETLNVSRSAFQGTNMRFPNLKRLRMQGLFLGHEVLSSSFFTKISQLTDNLTQLDISRNGLESLGGINLEKVPNLRTLDLRGNQLRELPRVISDMPFLSELLCGTNCLTEFSSWNPNLETLDLSYNQIDNIYLSAKESKSMVNLHILQLCANNIKLLPESLKLLPHLSQLDVRHNAIYNPLDAMVPSLCRLIASHNYPVYGEARGANNDESSNTDYQRCPVMEYVNSLDLRNTKMPYTAEFLFRHAPRLRVLDLRNNDLNQVPVCIDQLRNLEELYVACNNLVELPVEIFALPSLRVLDVHDNNIKTLPGHIWLAPKLSTLNISSNMIGQLPAHPSGINASQYDRSPIQSLFTCGNHLSEESFAELVHLKTLVVLDLSYNYITEVPSGVFLQFPNLEELYLSGNNISVLPHDNFEHARNLRVLHLASNYLHTLPADISKASRLEVLDLSANQLRYNVANWPFDWNWRWNKELKYLNLSYNKRLEIHKSPHVIVENGSEKVVDLSDFCVLPKLTSLGLMDVTVTTSSIPFQTSDCRVRTFGSDMGSYHVGIADTLGFRPLAINDMVVERFRNQHDECLVAMFDGFDEEPASGNRISHIAQESFSSIFKTELELPNTTVPEALHRAFLAIHREVGNAALLSPTEISHTALGHRCSAASKLTPRDWQAGTGATVTYICKSKLYIASVGGARVVLCRGNGTHIVLSKPLPPVGDEITRIRSSGGIVDPKSSLINGSAPYPRLIGCFTSGTAFSAAPCVFEYDIGETLDKSDTLLIGSGSLWSHINHETATKIVLSENNDPMLAALKVRNYAMAYGLRDRAMVMVVGHNSQVAPAQSSGSFDEDFGLKKRKYLAPVDSTLARLGSEVSPPSGEVTMVFTDIRSSTHLWESHPALMSEAIKTHNSLMRRSIRLMEGYEVKSEGDAFIISFHTPIKALLWCLTVQQHLLTAEWPEGLLEVPECAPIFERHTKKLIFRGLSVRMGIHSGRPVAEPDPVTRRMDYFGPMVNRTARISGIALGGQISVSADFLTTLSRDLAAHKKVLAGASPAAAYHWVSPPAAEALERSVAVLDHTDYVVEELGELKLRGIENCEHIYNVYPKSLCSRKDYYAECEIENENQNDSNQSSSERTSKAASDASLGLPSISSLSNIPALNASLGTISSLGSVGSTSMANQQFMQRNRRLDSGPSPQQRTLSQTSPGSRRDLSGGSGNFNSVTETLHKRNRSLNAEVKFQLEEYNPRKPNEAVQNIAQRIEALCAHISGFNDFNSHMALLKNLEPLPVTSRDEYLYVWTARVENAICRLIELLNSG